MTNPAYTEIKHSFIGPQANINQEADWLLAHNFIKDTNEPYRIDTIQDWNMPGGESYILEFSIHQRGEALSKYVIKACIKPMSSKVVADWMERRSVLQDNGIVVPELHAVSKGTYIEEYVPYDLRSVYKAADNLGKEALKQSFIDLHTVSREVGFRPLSFHDVRSHGSDLVVIDYGSDLGGIYKDPLQLSRSSIQRLAETDFHQAVL